VAAAHGPVHGFLVSRPTIDPSHQSVGLEAGSLWGGAGNGGPSWRPCSREAHCNTMLI
jgi:hypothetical protein